MTEKSLQQRISSHETATQQYRMKAKVVLMCIGIVTLSWVSVTCDATEAAGCKVLTVMLNSEPYGYNQEVKRGIDGVLKARCEISYVYLDAELNRGGLPAKVQETYALYQKLQPDGVITVEEETVPLFVVPYLKDKVQTPVMFLGILSPPENYGLPASNVSGMVMRSFFQETLAFLRQLAPKVQTIGLVCNDAPAARSGIPEVKKLYESLGMTMVDTLLSNNPEEVIAWVTGHTDKLDALFVCPILGEDIVKKIVAIFPKPTFSCWRVAIEYGIMAGVIDNGKDMGKRVAEMLSKAMDGTPMADIPIATPEFGSRVINVETLKALGLQPSRRDLTGVELIK